MTIWTTNLETALNSSPFNRSSSGRAFSKGFKVHGLNPGNQFKFYVNNVDMSWAVKQFGKRMGDDLIVGQDGKLDIQFLGQLLTGTIITDPHTTKFNTFELRDNLGITRATSIVPQYLSMVQENH